MKCPNTDQGTLDVSMDLPLKYSYTKAEINMIKVVFWSDLADCGEQDQRQENLKDINSSPIGRPWALMGVQWRQCRQDHRRGDRGKRCKEETRENVGTPQMPAARGVTAQSSRAGQVWQRVLKAENSQRVKGEVLARNRQKAWLRSETHGVVATHPRATQGKRAWLRAFHAPVTRGKGDKELRVLARDGQKHVQCRKSNRLEPSGEKFGKSYQKMYPISGKLFYRNTCVYKDIHTNSNRENQCNSVFNSQIWKKKVEMPIRRVLDMGHGKWTSIQRKLSNCYNSYNGSNSKWSANGSR